ncbi:MAG TPA: transposase [Bryobacteraceae bacterium]|nr:transposase [Bryobacteraceae bacterium]
MKAKTPPIPGLLRVTRNGKRFFSEEHKCAIVEKCLVPGASVSAVALAHGFNTNLVRNWISKHQARQGRRRPGTQLVPITVIEAASETAARVEPIRSTVSAVASGSIEIEIGGARVKVLGQVEAEQLRVVFEALRARR